MRFATKRDILEKRSLDLIFKAGDDGILQTDLWKKLSMSSREGSRICVRLESWGLIRRDKILCEGRWTYRIMSTRKPPSMGSILGSKRHSSMPWPVPVAFLSPLPSGS